MTDKVYMEEMEKEAEALKALNAHEDRLERERRKQEGLLVKEALRLLRQDKLKMDDITETFLLRRLLTGAFSASTSERQWAVGQLLALKGLKGRRSKKPEVDESMLDKLSSIG